MSGKRRVLSSGFKAKVALAAAKGDKTLSELSGQFGVYANQISAWKKQLVDQAPELFEDGRRRRRQNEQQTETAELYEQIGRLKMEVEWLKKKSDVGSGG